MEEDEQVEDFHARPYQEELMLQAKDNNSIIYLPTGSGKTYIAVMLIKEMSAALDEGKHTFFLVNTVALVSQQAAYLERHTRFSVGKYSGDMNVDLWTKEQWKEELDNHRIMVMTSQILVNLLCHGYARLEMINLIVFDECHHAVNDQPMRQIMIKFEDTPPAEQPRVLGLTATLLNSNCKASKVNDEVCSLEKTFQSKVATCRNMADVYFYSTNPMEKIVLYSDDEVVAGKDVLDRGIRMIQQQIDFIRSIRFEGNEVVIPKGVPAHAKILDDGSEKIKKKLSNLLLDVQIHTNMLGLFGGSYACLAHMIQLQRLKNKATDSFTKCLLSGFITTLTAVRKLYEDRMSDCTPKSRIMKYSSHKVLTLIEILKKYMPPDLVNPTSINSVTEGEEDKKKNFCTLVFVQRRFTAKIIYQVLKALSINNEEYRHISADFMVGFNNNPFNDTREGELEKKFFMKCVKDFQNGSTNVLVASDVLEEGMDIQQCNLVIKFDLITNYRSYVQSKGRARHRTSHYIIMVPRENTKFKQKYKEFQATEQALQELLIGRTNERNSPTEEEIAAELYDHLLPPYKTATSSVTLTSAIPLVNRYCSILPQDKYTTLAPVWYLVPSQIDGVKRLYVCLQLPMNSPLQELIKGKPMPSKKLAKRAVALETCMRLHKIGELNDNLLPVGRATGILDSSDLFPLYEVEENDSEDEQAKKFLRGSKKRKEYYPKQYPTFLSNCRPMSGIKLYLHVMELTPAYEPEVDNNRKLVFYNLLQRRETFAILCANKMPQVCDFPIYMNVGELKVNVVNNASCVTLSDDEIDEVESFNILLFDQLLKLMKHFMIVDKGNQENSYFVVPVIVGSSGTYEIDWNVVKEHQNLPDVQKPLEEEIQSLKITKEEFETFVVIPWYRTIMPDQNYIVTKVSEELTPISPFPSNDFGSYDDYYYRKYKLRIVHLEKPLLEVKAISNKINCLRPRGSKISKATSKRKRQEMQDDFEESLVPELCMKYLFPSVLWLKATCLPTILHRIHYLLLAEELRQNIAQDIGVGRKQLQPGEKWEPIRPDKFCVEEAPQNSPQHTSGVMNRPSSIRLNKSKLLNSENEPLLPEDKEPVDIDRNMDEVTLVEVLNFEEYIRKPLVKKAANSIRWEANYSNLDNQERNNLPVALDDDYGPAHVEIDILNAGRGNFGPQQYELLQALTSAGAGDIMNLERLETLGDSFLKFMCSVYLYLHYPGLNEGKLTEVKGKMLGNRNLFYCGRNRKLGGYMKVQEFIPRSDWIPPSFCVCRRLQQVIRNVKVSPNVLYEVILPEDEQMNGFLSNSTFDMISEKLLTADVDTGMHASMGSFLSLQSVPDKTIADGVEALIGAYLKACGIRGALKLLGWLQILPAAEATPECMFDMPPPTADLKFINTGERGEIILHLTPGECRQLEGCLGYTFKDRSYLLQALSHPSFSVNRITDCYQRLEFIGDAILDFLITCHVYETCGILSPGELTDLRSALVNNVTFASLSVRYGFHKYLKYTSTKLMDMVDRFVKYQEDSGHIINEEVLILIEEKDTCLSEAVDVPKVLGDLFESIAGAIYLDSGMDLKAVWRVYYRLMRKEIRTFSKTVPKNPVRLLYESVSTPPEFLTTRLIPETGSIMMPVKVRIGDKWQFFYGVGATKVQAKRAAAKHALKKLIQE